MSKVIVERARPGSSRHVKRRAKRFDTKRVDLSDDSDDPLGGRIGHRRAVLLTGAGRKWLNENLRPLQRFLRKQVGRPWDAVWSEITRHVRPSNAVQQHVLDHVQDFVAHRTLVRDGEVLLHTRWAERPQPFAAAQHIEMYVDPRTGILRSNPAFRLQRAEQRREKLDKQRALAARRRVIGKWRQLHLLADGNWWEVTLARVPRQQVRTANGGWRMVDAAFTDVVARAGLTRLSLDELYNDYTVYAVDKRQLSAREMKDQGLARPSID